MPPADPHLTRLRARTAIFALFALASLLLSAPAALANGPRWVTGAPYFNTAGAAVVWSTTSPLYFTDPGNLSASVNHASADALVAAAANVWNIPTSAVVLAQGGTLAEHVSGANSYLSSTGPVFPSDVQPANYSAIQIAVLYDSDGSITDMLLGSGASSPAECRQNAVTEDVDSIIPAGFIQHAILVLNGRCNGPAPQQQLQMQYQLERAFGRILGLGWSQTNDNVFTRTPQPTTVQAQNWPIMHPIDIICGAYTYQCLPQPFTLRDDDIASISGLYPLFAFMPFPAPTPAPGKTWSYIQAGVVSGTLSFPTGEGMQGVNIVLQRWRGGTGSPQPWQDVSAVSGFTFQRNAGNPVTGISSSLTASLGTSWTGMQGYFQFSWVPDADPLGSFNGPMLAVLTTEPINPLYTGAYSVGPYTQAAVSPSGSPQSKTSRDPIWPYTYASAPTLLNLPAPVGAAANCDTSADGTETAPASFAATGWSTGVLCAHGHSAWFNFSAQAGRTATLEVTALDESGYATTSKSMPLLGVWNSADPTGTLPTVAATPSAFNTIALGTTAATLAVAQPQSLRFVIADARGDGRPDYAYRARVLYADSILPAVTSVNGGLVTITGTGFRPGNAVTVNGVAAVVSSWTANTIVTVAPPLSLFPPTFSTPPSAPVDITVSDLATGGSTTMSAALTYSNAVAPDIMTLVSTPPAMLPVGTPATFAVRVLLGDGVTPIAGLPVTFTWTGPAQLAGCATSPCTLLTDSTGLASTTVTPTAFGSITLQASAVGATQTVTFTAVARSVSALQPVEYIAANATVAAPLMWTPQVSVIQNAGPAAGVAVDWAGTIGFSLAPASTTTNANGIASISTTLGPLASGTQATAQACAWNNARPRSAPPSPPSPSTRPPCASSSSAAPARPSPRPPPSRPSSSASPTPPAIPSPARPSTSTRPSTPPRCPAPRTAHALFRPLWLSPPPPRPLTSTASSASSPRSSPPPAKSPTSLPPPAARASPPSPLPSSRNPLPRSGPLLPFPRESACRLSFPKGICFSPFSPRRNVPERYILEVVAFSGSARLKGRPVHAQPHPMGRRKLSMTMKMEMGAATAAAPGCSPTTPALRTISPSRSSFNARRALIALAALAACLAPLAAAHPARAQRVGPPAPITYDNKYEIYGGLNYMNFKAGENLPKRMNLGGAEISGTWWLNSHWGAVADYRGGAGTTQVFPNAEVYGIHRPLVFMNMALFGAQYRGPKNQFAAVNYHAYGGIAMGVFDDGTQGAGPGNIYTATQNAQLVGLYANKTAPIFALGGSLDINRSRNWALRLSPDLILEHFGNEEREFFAISGGVVYRFPPRGAKKK